MTIVNNVSEHFMTITRLSKVSDCFSYNKNQPNALISQIYSWNETLHVLDSSSVYHQEFSTVHTAMVYVIQVC